jgi:Protein of unknown function (DUF3551)
MTLRHGVIALALIFSSAAYAQNYTSSEYCDPWCTRNDGRDCNYHTFWQCLATIRGTASTCYRNPFLSLCRRQTEEIGPSRRR